MNIEQMAREAGLERDGTRWFSDSGDPLAAQDVEHAALERFAALVRDQALADAAAAVDALTEQVAEHLYGHPREKAIEWAKEDKFDSCALQAEEMLAFPLRAIRALAATPPRTPP